MFTRTSGLVLLWALVWSYGFAFPVSSWFFEDLGMSPAAIQRLRAFFTTTCVVVAPITGYLADRWGRRRLAAVGCGALFAASVIYVFATAPWQAYAAEVLIAFGQACALAAIPALLYEASGASFARVWGWCIFAECLYWVTANAVGGAIAARWGLRAPWILAMAGYGAAMPLALVLGGRRGEQPPESGPVGEKPFRLADLSRLVASPQVLGCVLLFGLLSASYRAVMYLEPEYLKQSGIAKEWSGVIIGLGYLPVGLTALLAGRFEGALGGRLTMPLLLAIQGAGFLGMALFFGHAGWLWVFLHTVVRGATRVDLFARANRACEELGRGSSNALLNLADRTAAVAILLAIGMLLDRQGLVSTLWCLASAWACLVQSP